MKEVLLIGGLGIVVVLQLLILITLRVQKKQSSTPVIAKKEEPNLSFTKPRDIDRSLQRLNSKIREAEKTQDVIRRKMDHRRMAIAGKSESSQVPRGDWLARQADDSRRHNPPHQHGHKPREQGVLRGSGAVVEASPMPERSEAPAPAASQAALLTGSAPKEDSAMLRHGRRLHVQRRQLPTDVDVAMPVESSLTNPAAMPSPIEGSVSISAVASPAAGVVPSNSSLTETASRRFGR